MSAATLRSYIVVLIRDLVTPGAGVLLAVKLGLSGGLEPFHLPLIAGMLGIPLVARGSTNGKA